MLLLVKKCGVLARSQVIWCVSVSVCERDFVSGYYMGM